MFIDSTTFYGLILIAFVVGFALACLFFVWSQCRVKQNPFSEFAMRGPGATGLGQCKGKGRTSAYYNEPHGNRSGARKHFGPTLLSTIRRVGR